MLCTDTMTDSVGAVGMGGGRSGAVLCTQVCACVCGGIHDWCTGAAGVLAACHAHVRVCLQADWLGMLLVIAWGRAILAGTAQGAGGTQAVAFLIVIGILVTFVAVVVVVAVICSGINSCTLATLAVVAAAAVVAVVLAIGINCVGGVHCRVSSSPQRHRGRGDRGCGGSHQCCGV